GRGERESLPSAARPGSPGDRGGRLAAGAPPVASEGGPGAGKGAAQASRAPGASLQGGGQDGGVDGLRGSDSGSGAVARRRGDRIPVPARGARGGDPPGRTTGPARQQVPDRGVRLLRPEGRGRPGATVARRTDPATRGSRRAPPAPRALSLPGRRGRR